MGGEMRALRRTRYRRQMPGAEDELGIKRLSVANWLKPDPTLPPYVRYCRARATQEEMGAGQWAEAFLAYRLGEHVPRELRRLFEVARGAMLYGFFFYPLYTVGLERLYQPREAAVARRYRDASGPARLPSGDTARYVDMIDWLAQHGLIQRSRVNCWQRARQLRNVFAHPHDQMIQLPVEGRALASVVEDLNLLFEAKSMRLLSWEERTRQSPESRIAARAPVS